MEQLIDTLKLGIAPSIILALFLIINKIIDSRKESTQVKITSELTNTMANINNFIVNITKDVIDNDKDKCEIAARDALNSANLHIIDFVNTTLINNHIINNKENIISNLNNLVKAEYWTLYRTLSMYTINRVNVSSVIKSQWIDETVDVITKIMYNQKLDTDSKILTASKRLNSLFNTYITYINNNGIK